MDAGKVYESWVNHPGIDESIRQELIAIKDDANEIEERFYRELEFGTAGLRGILGAGTNRMNMYTVAKATQGLADYINSMKADADTLRSVAIAYDSRHMSTEFADISAAVLNANGIRAYVFDSLRPTPELSFAVRYLKCIAGINVTASHNPAKYNGYKVYWEDGAQVSEPFDQEIMACVNKITDMLSPKLMPKDEAVAKGLYVQIGEDVDNAYMDAVCTTIKDAELIKNKGKDISVVYTPLHGAGIKIVPKLLERVGFTNVHIVKEQAVPDGDFPTVEFPNPEITDALKLAHDLAVQVNADLVLGTDPDSDRMGVMVRDADGNFHNLTGNLIGCILCEYLMKKMKTSGQMPKDGYIIRSIVSSQLADQVAAEYGAELREVLTGFKWIGRNILESEKAGKGTFIFGFEESCGYLAGTYARDKDACGAVLTMCEACTYYKGEGLTMWDVAQDMYKRYGFVKEQTISITREGQEGLKEIAAIMDKIRKAPFTEIAGYPVVRFRDFEKPEETGLAKSNVLFFTLENGWVCVRPSGTEPKIKYYMGVRCKTEADADAMLAEMKKYLVG